MKAKLLLGLSLLLVSAPELGCGHCSGAIRKMRAQRAEWVKRGGGGRGGCSKARRGQGPGNLARVVRIHAKETFRIRADGPMRSSAELLKLSGVGPQSWVLRDDRAGQSVPVEITADAGGHMCLHGVGFNLRPRVPLAPGGYTMVLYLDRVRWPLAAPDDRVTYQGRPALVRRFLVQ